MADRANQSFEVAPTRIGGTGGAGRPGRRRRIPTVLIIIIALAIPTVAWIGPRIEWRPEVDLSFLRPTPTPVASPTPRPTGTPTPAPPTPLPAITIGAGTHPSEPIPIDVDGMRFADPTTGSLGPPLGLRGDTDAIFTSAGGDGWWCVCFVRAAGSDRESVTVEIKRLDRSGRVTMRQTIGEYESVAPPPAQDFYTRFDVVVSPDKRTAYLASATRAGAEWSIAVVAINVATGNVAARADLGRVAIPPITGPTPAPDQGIIENYFNGPSLRMSPDGRRILAWASVESYTAEGAGEPVSPQAWMIDLDPAPADGSIGRLTTLGEASTRHLRSCYWVAWTTNSEIAATCWPIDPSSSTVRLVLLDPEGTVEQGHIDLPGLSNNWVAEPVLDRAHRLLFMWQPEGHTLSRVDLERQVVEDLRVDPKAIVTPPSGSGPPASGSGPRQPEWATLASDTRMYYAPQLLAEPAGNRLFALGMIPTPNNMNYTFASTGIWVFDSTTFSLVDHWSAVAAYGSIGLSADGRWLLGAGVPGIDADANQTSWEASITVHDLTDGRPALQLGSLGTEGQVMQVPP